MSKQELGPLQKEWIAALRSGKYKQGKNALHRISSDEWCCLGVLCDLTSDRLGVSRSNLGEYETFGCCDSVPIASIVEAIRLYNTLGSTLFDKGTASLVDLNDVHGSTFPEIADILESNPEAYFEGPA